MEKTMRVLGAEDEGASHGHSHSHSHGHGAAPIEIDAHASGVSYVLLAKVINVGVAILVYARDETIARRVTDVKTTWTGCGIAGWMGNKGAVGVRFRVTSKDIGREPDMIYT